MLIMTLFEAPQYDPRRARRRKQLIAAAILGVIVLAALAWIFRNWPEERIVTKFFTALQNKDFETAYALWIADPDWKQHPNQHAQYKFGDFYNDWGPGGDWGPIRNFRIEGSANPQAGSGVVVVVTINDRKEPARIWVEKKDKSMTFSPY
ncbi:MAG TPA: hypothetical protein VK473_18080 [Terriglobales bacterium]|nr:hypothetical protein [Terriglobales bacterium]